MWKPHGRSGCWEAVAVHVLEPQLGVAGAEAVVLDAGTPDGAEALGDHAVGGPSAGAQHAALADPYRLPFPADDPRPALAHVTRQPRLPQVGRYRPGVQGLVAPARR